MSQLLIGFAIALGVGLTGIGCGADGTDGTDGAA